MAIRKTNLVSGEIYHIYNRGVDKRTIFIDEGDKYRFVHDLFEFNDKNPTTNMSIYLKNNPSTKEVGLPKLKRQPRELLVEILAYCLMDNHFHLMVKQKSEKGISEFMQKLGTGYTNYFNKKYDRSGVLFQGKFKSVHLSNISHFLYLPIYIHLNPLDFKFPEWREKKVKDFKSAINFLENYRWSSYLDYIGKKNFPSLIKKDFILSRFNNSENKLKKENLDWIKLFNENEIREVVLE